MRQVREFKSHVKGQRAGFAPVMAVGVGAYQVSFRGRRFAMLTGGHRHELRHFAECARIDSILRRLD